MRMTKLLGFLALSLLAGAQQVRSTEPTNQAPANVQRKSDIEVPNKWQAEPSWSHSGPMPRHYIVKLWGVPSPYQGMTNPLPKSKDTYALGEQIYKSYCALCHGDNGYGTGITARMINPPPGNLSWLSDVPEKQWDEFMVWTISEGGTALGTAMPPYKQLLTNNEIWAVSAYIQKNIPVHAQVK